MVLSKRNPLNYKKQLSLKNRKKIVNKTRKRLLKKQKIRRQQRAGAAAPPNNNNITRRLKALKIPIGAAAAANNNAVEIEIPDTQELVTYFQSKKKSGTGASVTRKIKTLCSKMLGGKKIKWEKSCQDDLEQIARTALSEAASASASASASSNTKKTKKGPRFQTKIGATATDEEGVTVGKEWSKEIKDLIKEAGKSSGKKVPNITKPDGKLQALNKGEVFVPLELLEKILSIKIKDKQAGVEGLLFQKKDSAEKLKRLETLIAKVKEIHKREGKSYMLVDFKRMGSTMYSKLRFPQKEFSYKQLNKLLGYKVFPESPGDRDGGVGASINAIQFPSTKGLAPIFPSTRGLVQSIGKSKSKTRAKQIAVPK